MSKTTQNDLQDQIRVLEEQLTEPDRADKRLNDLEKKYQVLVEHANDAIFVLQDGKVEFANPRSLEIVGIMAEELDGKSFEDFLHPDEKEKVVQRHQKRLKGEKVLNMYPLRLINSAGDVVWVEVNAVRIEWLGKPATLNIIRDITFQKLYEAAFSQANKLTTVRTLAGGLAHELNNLLMGIQGRASLLTMGLGSASPLQAHVDQMEELIREAAKLSKQLVGFAQCGKYRVDQVDINRVLEEAVASISCSNKKITIQKRFDAALWHIEADRSQIDQALMSVVLNARQAIEDTGTISLTTENIILREARPHIENLIPGRYVKISIKDDGMGMDDTIRKRVFEPFFTTKVIGRHRGLGLACAYGIIVNHGGLIDVTSAPDMGSNFTIWLPAADNKPSDPGGLLK